MHSSGQDGAAGPAGDPKSAGPQGEMAKTASETGKGWVAAALGSELAPAAPQSRSQAAAATFLFLAHLAGRHMRVT
jgi:hypothetical protein